MRWTQAVLLTRALSCGRRSRVVLTPRRWRQARGSDPRRRRWQESPVTGRARRKPLKPSRAGMPGDPGATVVTNARAFYTHARLRVHRAPGIPHALCWAERSCTTRASSRRGMAEVYLSYPCHCDPVARNDDLLSVGARVSGRSHIRMIEPRSCGVLDTAFAEYGGFMRGLAEIRIRKPASTAKHDPEKWTPVFRKDHAETKR